jgi:E3 ubiquitin-protein ligase MARCH5
MGYEEGRRLVDEADILLLIIGLPAIPIGLILAKLIKWEDFILKLWRRSAFSLPRPLSYIIDKPPAKPRANCDQLLLDPGFNEPLGCTRMICGALLLPTVSALVGKIFFSHIGGSQWRRSLVGGLAFLLIKGALKIYLRKSQYIRYSQRSIKNYVPSAKTAQRSSGTDLTDIDGGDDSHTTTVTSHEAETPNSDEDLLDGDSDDEELLPRTRTMFSMTISLGR